MSWRDTIKEARRVVHDTFAMPVTIHFADHDLPVSARRNRENAVVGQEGYAQALVMSNQLKFMVEDLEGYVLERGLTIETPDGLATIDSVHPVDVTSQLVDVTY